MTSLPIPARIKHGLSSLTGKLAIALILTTLVLMPTIYFGLRMVVLPTFSTLQEDAVRQQVERVNNGIEDFGKEVVRATRDYAVWDDSYAYLAHPDPKFEAETLSPLAQKNLDVEFFGYVRFTGEVVRGEAIDFNTVSPLPAEAKILRAAITSPAFLRQARRNEVYNSFFSTERGVYAIATGWVKKSDGTGSPQGFVAMGRRMESADLTAVLRVPVRIHGRLAASDPLSGELARPPHRYAELKPGAVESVQGLLGADGKLVGYVRFQTALSISALGAQTIILGTVLVLGVMVAVLVVLSVLVRYVAIRRLAQLAEHMRKIGESGEVVSSDLGKGGDEIASLARGFDDMSLQLHRAREELRVKSYTQGTADSAAGALHNLRNAIGPVRALQQKWQTQETASWRGNLARAVTELGQASNAERAAALTRFVTAAAGRCVQESQERVLELEESRVALDQVIQILAGQDELANRPLELEPNDTLEMLNQAATIARRFGAGDIKVTLPASAPRVLANVNQLSQLLGNLFKNAAESLYNCEQGDRQIEVAAGLSQDGQHVQIAITDNGEGIAAEVAPKLFVRGFSTRHNKSGGLGLHWCANSAGAMKGSLRMESRGVGQGATAILTLQAIAADGVALAA